MIISKVWMDRLVTLEKRASVLFADKELDMWIREHIHTQDFFYFGILTQVPNHLKKLCAARAFKQMEECEISEETRQ